MSLPTFPLNPDIPALGIRQPWVELILRQEKTLEVRSQPTHIRGEIYLYSAKQFSDHPSAQMARQRLNLPTAAYGRGLLVGRAWLVDCRPARPGDADLSGVGPDALAGQQVWVLERAERFEEPVLVRYLPFGVWFYPFRRKGDAGSGAGD
jgi:hypothetical protein